jgi:hypothetical protein
MKRKTIGSLLHEIQRYYSMDHYNAIHLVHVDLMLIIVWLVLFSLYIYIEDIVCVQETDDRLTIFTPGL